MTATQLDLFLRSLEPADLAEVESTAARLTRRDRKYIVPRSVADSVLLHLQFQSSAKVLEIHGNRSFRYETVYFDTPDLAMYFAAARNRPHRFKIRTRSYIDTGECALEVKIRDGHGTTTKHRCPHPIDASTRLTATGRAFVEQFCLLEPADVLHPILTTRYRRSTLLLPTSASRVTIDSALECIDHDGARVAVVDVALIETKSGTKPTEVDRLLWTWRHRPSRISKYCTGLAAIRGDLPANRWHRTLRRHFGGRAPG